MNLRLLIGDRWSRGTLSMVDNASGSGLANILHLTSYLLPLTTYRLFSVSINFKASQKLAGIVLDEANCGNALKSLPGSRTRRHAFFAI
jgi:hypothetical protein